MKKVISVQQLMKHIIAGEKNQLEQIKKPYLRLNLNTAFTIYFTTTAKASYGLKLMLLSDCGAL